MINSIRAGEPNFRAARVNACALADGHGNTMRIPKLLRTIENNIKDIFPKTGEPSTANFLLIDGDWFINPSKKGFLTRPELSNGDLQNLALLKTIDIIKNYIRNLSAKSTHSDKKRNSEIDVLYTMGNHCLDGGTQFMLNVMKKNPMVTLVSNVNMDKSPMIKDAMQKHENIKKSAIYSIPDSKNPNLLHMLLFLGVTIPSMDFYNPGLCEGLEFYDNSNKKDANINEEDLQGTIAAVKEEVDNFKSKYPKGAVIVLSHMGNKLSEILQKNVPQINHILNGHDHKTTQINVGKTSINSLGKDNEMFKSLNLEFDDNGNLVKSTMTPFFTETTLADGLEEHPFQQFLDKSFAKDMEPLVSLDELKSDAAEQKNFDKTQEIINALERLNITDSSLQKKLMQNESFTKLLLAESDKKDSVKGGMTQLSYGNEIRYKNSYLMNYLTSALKRRIREKYDSDIFTVALQSSIVRGGIEDKADNLSLMKIFDGVSENLSNLKIGDVTGEELTGLIVENILSNLKAPTRNTIIHWSDVQVNRSLIESINNGTSSAKYSDAVRVRNPITKEFEPIDMNENYRMVIGEKFLVKDDIEWPRRIRGKFKSLDTTYDQVFRDYISSVDYKLHITPKTKEERIL